MSECKRKAVLIGAGDTRQDTFCIRKTELVIALDGGLVFCAEHNITPDYIIGDFDSLPKEMEGLLEKYPRESIMRLPCEKDDTDMLFAIKFAIEKGVREFEIWGGLGGRLSHTLANLQCLMYLKERGMKGVLCGKDTKAFLLQNEDYTFEEKERGYLSIFAYSKKAEGVILKNLKYELSDAVITSAFPIGVSNEFVQGKTAHIEVKEGTLLVVLDR